MDHLGVTLPGQRQLPSASWTPRERAGSAVLLRMAGSAECQPVLHVEPQFRMRPPPFDVVRVDAHTVVAMAPASAARPIVSTVYGVAPVAVHHAMPSFRQDTTLSESLTGGRAKAFAAHCVWKGRERLTACLTDQCDLRFVFRVPCASTQVAGTRAVFCAAARLRGREGLAASHALARGIIGVHRTLQSFGARLGGVSRTARVFDALDYRGFGVLAPNIAQSGAW